MIFLDTNFLVSYYVSTEEHYKRALEIAKDIVGEEQIISRLIIAEPVNVLYNKLKMEKEKVMELFNKLNKNYTIIEDHYIYYKTMQMIINYEKRLPFFDFVFMCVMEELGIKKIATFDEHLCDSLGPHFSVIQCDNLLNYLNPSCVRIFSPKTSN